jgi:hypothetical protein
MTSPALLSIILIVSNFASFIAKSSLVIRRTDIAKFLLTIWQSNVDKFTFCNLAISLLLSSNNRICSFIWIRGSKHCFLTSFSNLYRYFLFLVFFETSLLTSFFAPFFIARDSNFLSHFYTFCTPDTKSYMRPHVSGTLYAFSQSKTLMGTWYQD